MSTTYINRINDEEIIDIVRTVMDNGTGKAETPYEHILLKLMQIRGTPISSYKFDQERVDFHYRAWELESYAGNRCVCPKCYNLHKPRLTNPRPKH